jgi:hypothetical protein
MGAYDESTPRRYVLDDDTWIELPAEFTGRDVVRRDKAVEKLKDSGRGITLDNFMVSVALLQNWQLPGLGGNVEQWNIEELPLKVIAWVNGVVLGEFQKCFLFPRHSLRPSVNGLKETIANGEAPGTLEVNG